MSKVLLIDDDVELVAMFQEYLEREGFEVKAAHDGLSGAQEAYYRDVLGYEPRTVAPDIMARWPPTEVSEGYNYEAVQENYVITDNSRILRIYYVQPLRHVGIAGQRRPQRLAQRQSLRLGSRGTDSAEKPMADVASGVPPRGRPV